MTDAEKLKMLRELAEELERESEQTFKDFRGTTLGEIKAELGVESRTQMDCARRMLMVLDAPNSKTRVTVPIEAFGEAVL